MRGKVSGKTTAITLQPVKFVLVLLRRTGLAESRTEFACHVGPTDGGERCRKVRLLREVGQLCTISQFG
eukprot:6188961-Pleurochrysis_carterae.AAC.2